MDAQSYSIRPYQPGDENAILRLFNEVFSAGAEDFKPRRLEEWHWEYGSNPAGQQVMVAVQPDGRVIAHYACWPVRVQTQGEESLAGQGVDSMVHPEFRRGLKKEGPFLAVARGYFSTWGNAKVCSFGFGFPNQRAFRIGVRVLKYVPVFQPVPTLYRNFFESADDDQVGRQFAGAAEVTEVHGFGPEFNSLWQQLAEHYPMAILRNARYLQYRYGECPLEYRCFAVRNGAELRGLFVLRPGWQGLPILALADLLCHPEDEAVQALAFRTAVSVARETKQARIEAWFNPNSAAFQSGLRHGFRTEPSQYVLCIMLYRGHPEPAWVEENWYYTIGDSDVF
jgi:hypothetical protein